MSRVQPGEVAAQLPTEPPQQARDLDDIVADLDRIVTPGITHWNHPGFLAHFRSNSDLASVLADIVPSGLGVQGMSWLTNPAATEVEDVVMEWLREMVGLLQMFTGAIEAPPSTSTSTARTALRSAPRESRRTAAARRPRARRWWCTPATRRKLGPKAPRLAGRPSTCASSRRGPTSTRPARPAQARRRGGLASRAACAWPPWLARIRDDAAIGGLVSPRSADAMGSGSRFHEPTPGTAMTRPESLDAGGRGAC